jgi:hypothetical protein
MEISTTCFSTLLHDLRHVTWSGLRILWTGSTVLARSSVPPRTAKIGNCVSNCLAENSLPDADVQVVTLSLPGDKKATSGATWRRAEGTGVEPATGKPAPDFESGC